MVCCNCCLNRGCGELVGGEIEMKLKIQQRVIDTVYEIDRLNDKKLYVREMSEILMITENTIYKLINRFHIPYWNKGYKIKKTRNI